MGDNNEMSDADKMRLKRLARLAGTSTPTQTDASSSSQASSAATPAAPIPVHTPASASSRLLSTPQPAIAIASSSSSAPKPSPSPSISIKPSLVPRGTKASPSLTLGKRPSSTTPASIEPVGPRVVSSRPAASLPNIDYHQWETIKVGEVFSVTLNLIRSGQSRPLRTTIDLVDRLLIARLSLDLDAMSKSEFSKFSFSGEERIRWTASFDKIKALIISYCGMTLEDPTMFPQPPDKPVGPAEFLPLLLAVTSTSDSSGDPLTASTSAKPVVQTKPGALSGADLLPFLNDLAIGFPSETMSDVITPTLSLFFQEWYKITPTPDILGSDWRRYLGAVAVLVQVKSIAASLEWQSLLGPLTRLSVYPREFPEVWKTYFSNPTDRKKEDIEANKSNLRHTLGGLHMDKVDVSYFKTSKRVDITEETKIKATKEEADEYFGNAMEDHWHAYKGGEEYVGDREGVETGRSDQAYLGREPSHGSTRRSDYQEVQGEFTSSRPKLIILPLPAESPLEFRMLPEYLFDNIAEYFDFLARYDPDALDDIDKDILITFIITFLSPGYVNNPFLKAKLVSILSYGLWPMGYWRKGALFDRLSVHSLSTDYLMPTLIRFFIDVEATGGHTQFWDKFNFRRDIQRIFKSMWTNPLHREAFVKTRHNDFDQFIRFVNMLMSDTTFHLEESLTGLAKISSIQNQKANVEAWEALPQNEREDTESQLRQTEGSAPFHTQMGLENIKLIRDLTATTKEPFVTQEIVDRLAASLDENLVVLVGPKMAELKVSNPEKYSFKPKDLLAAIAQIYLNLANESDFIRAVANDGRSYSKELFEKFARTLKHRAIMTDAEVAEVVSFTQKVEDMKATISMEDEREIPDEFLDPLLSTLMKDPVILPVSRVVIDRGTIRTVLLSKEVDPFNNVPLKYEDCIPDTELKAKIDAWVAEGQTQQAAGVMDVDKL
ncbi:hypothetical protein IAT40_006102 [Kwoniella sp. CBS 6097]